jgi:hypothetical protein
MPAIKLANTAAGTANALSGLPFDTIPANGALVTIWGSTAVAGGNISFSIGSERYLVSAQLNIESSADVVDTDRDLVLSREPVAAGKMFLAVDAQVCNTLTLVEALPV